MTNEEIKKLKNVIMLNLYTTDKRIMFLKCCFSDYNIASHIIIEGTSYNCAHGMVEWFKRNNMIGSLIACLNSIFKSDLTLTYFDN